MSEVRLLEKRIEGLSDADLAELRAWFVEFDMARWDRQIEEDAAAGKLDKLVEEARRDYAKGSARPL